MLRTGYPGSEALLLGLLRVEDCLAARALGSVDVTLARARAQVVRRVTVGETTAPEQIPFTPQAKHALERALHEALGMGHNYAGTEHILLGVADADEGVARGVLSELGADGQKIREAITRLGDRLPTVIGTGVDPLPRTR